MLGSTMEMLMHLQRMVGLYRSLATILKPSHRDARHKPPARAARATHHELYIYQPSQHSPVGK